MPLGGSWKSYALARPREHMRILCLGLYLAGAIAHSLAHSGYLLIVAYAGIAGIIGFTLDFASRFKLGRGLAMGITFVSLLAILLDALHLGVPPFNLVLSYWLLLAGLVTVTVAVAFEPVPGEHLDQSGAAQA
jgi:hypothetical protein